VLDNKVLCLSYWVFISVSLSPLSFIIYSLITFCSVELLVFYETLAVFVSIFVILSDYLYC